MSSSSPILLGYEVPSGNSVYLDLKHTAIFGMTQSGKTTALEALITRSKLKAIAFIVKRGEAGFHVYNQILPYYKPRSDWQYVEGLLNVALREKVQYQPFMRWAILQVTKKHPANLREVLTRSEECETDYPRRKEVFEQLSAYLRIVVPELEHQTFATTLDLQDGVNVMDLNDMTLEVQQIVIASTIEYVFKTLDHVIVIIPEAWESLPQGKMTPIKWVAEQFVRKGAVLGNYMWLDSQDIGGIDKTPLRQCDNWILGRMKEAHEIERILKQLLGVKVQAKEIQTLPVGHFYCALGNKVSKVYVLPSNVPENVGIEVAKGRRSPESVKEFLQNTVANGDLMYKEKYEESEKRVRELTERNKQLENEAILTRGQQADKDSQAYNELKESFIQETSKRDIVIQNLEKKLEGTDKFREALRDLIGVDQIPTRDPTVNASQVQDVHLEAESVNYAVSHSEKTVEITTRDQQGQILFCALNDLPREGFTEKEMSDVLQERGFKIGHGSLAPQLNANLLKKGLLIRVPADPANHKAVKYRLPAKVNIKNAKETV
jgi:DNA segregation ATPase FtsK/SpoIIIE-like protein